MGGEMHGRGEHPTRSHGWGKGGWAGRGGGRKTPGKVGGKGGRSRLNEWAPGQGVGNECKYAFGVRLRLEGAGLRSQRGSYEIVGFMLLLFGLW